MTLRGLSSHPKRYRHPFDFFVTKDSEGLLSCNRQSPVADLVQAPVAIAGVHHVADPGFRGFSITANGSL